MHPHCPHSPIRRDKPSQPGPGGPRALSPFAGTLGLPGPLSGRGSGQRGQPRGQTPRGPWVGHREAAPGVPSKSAQTDKTLNLCSLFGAWFPHPVSRALQRRFSRGDLNMGSALRKQSGARPEGVWGRGGTSSMHPQIPLRDTALSRPRGEHQAPRCHQHRSWESSVKSRNCHLLHPAPQRGWGGGRAPSPSPTRLIAIVRAAERPGGAQEFAVLGEGSRTCPKPRIRRQEGGLSSFWGREGAAVSGQPGRWCQQRRGRHREGAGLCSCPRGNAPSAPGPPALSRAWSWGCTNSMHLQQQGLGRDTGRTGETGQKPPARPPA